MNFMKIFYKTLYLVMLFVLSSSVLSASNFGFGASIGYATFNMDQAKTSYKENIEYPADITDEFPGNLYYKLSMNKVLGEIFILGAHSSYTTTRYYYYYPDFSNGIEDDSKFFQKTHLTYINIGLSGDVIVKQNNDYRFTAGAEAGYGFIFGKFEDINFTDDDIYKANYSSWSVMPRIGAYKLFNRFEIGVQVGWLIEFGQESTNVFEFDGLRAGINFNYYFGDFNFQNILE
jgi:hypothetical protein